MMKAEELDKSSDIARHVPREDFKDSLILHFIWSGGAIRDSALTNVLAWGAAAKTAGWTVFMWTDEVNSTWNGWKRAQLYFTNITLKTITQADVDPRFWKDYVALVRGSGKKNYPAASDLARYCILQKYGGMYLDVDIGPGGFSLPKKSPYRHNPLPLMAPQLRDTQAVRETLNLNKNAKITADEVRRAARIQMEKGIYNNNFIVSHAGSEAMEVVIQHVASTVLKYGGSKSLLDMPDNAAITTGPGVVFRGLLDYVEKHAGVSTNTAKDVLTAAMFHELDLEWVTEESEFQEH